MSAGLVYFGSSLMMAFLLLSSAASARNNSALSVPQSGMSSREAEMAGAAMMFQTEQGDGTSHGMDAGLGLPMLPSGSPLPSAELPPNNAGVNQDVLINTLLSGMEKMSAARQSTGALALPGLHFLGTWFIQLGNSGFILGRNNGLEQRTVPVTGGSFGPKLHKPPAPSKSHSAKDHKPNAADLLDALANPNSKGVNQTGQSANTPTTASPEKRALSEASPALPQSKIPSPPAGQQLVGHPVLQGIVLPYGADWQQLDSTSPDENTTLNMRLVLRTHDNALITQTLSGYRHGSPDVMRRLARGEAVPADQYYFRVTVRFESSAPAYAWLNNMVCIGTAARQGTDILMDVYVVQ